MSISINDTHVIISLHNIPCYHIPIDKLSNNHLEMIKNKQFCPGCHIAPIYGYDDPIKHNWCQLSRAIACLEDSFLPYRTESFRNTKKKHIIRLLRNYYRSFYSNTS